MNGLNLKLILSLVDKITGPVRKLRDQFVTKIKAMSDAVFKFGERFEKVGKKISEAGGWLTTRVTLPIAGLGIMSVRTAGQVEQLALQLEGVAGGATEAEAYLKKLMAFNRGKPFELGDLVNAAGSLRSAGYDEDRTGEILAMTGEMAAKMKKPISEVVGLYLDMRMAGKVGASELLNMTKAQVPLVAQLAQTLGVSEQRVYKLAEDGKISFRQVRDAMREITKEGGALHGTMNKYGRSIFGMFDDLKRGISETLGVIGADLYKQLAIGEKIQKLTEIIRSLAEGFMALPQPVKDFLVWGALIAAVLGPVVLVIGQLAIGFGLLSMGISMLVPLFTALGAAFTFVMGLLSPLVLLVGGMAVAGYMLVKHWDKVAAFFTDLWASVKESFSSAIDWIMEKVDGFLQVVDKVKGGFAALKNLVTDNSVTRGWNRLFAEDAQPGQDSQSAAAPMPMGAAGAAQRVDTGGVMTIKVDQEGRVKSVAAQPNDRRMDYSVDTGLVMGGY